MKLQAYNHVIEPDLLIEPDLTRIASWFFDKVYMHYA